MEADISGYQRKVVSWRVRPTRRELGESGIPLRGGRTLPFEVTRGWSAPAGVYPEQWFLVDPETREVIHASPRAERAIWGLQGVTEVTDEVRTPLELAPGTYLLVFSLAALKGGEVEVEAVDVSSREAA